MIYKWLLFLILYKYYNFDINNINVSEFLKLNNIYNE